MALLSKNTTMKYKTSSDGDFVLATGLLSVPALSGEKSLIETTDLSDASIKNIHGLKDVGDLSLQFNYPEANEPTETYRKLRIAGDADEQVEFKITLPDNTEFAFTGQPDVVIDEITVNDRITFTIKIALSSEIVITDPSVSV